MLNEIFIPCIRTQVSFGRVSCRRRRDIPVVVIIKLQMRALLEKGRCPISAGAGSALAVMLHSRFSHHSSHFDSVGAI